MLDRTLYLLADGAPAAQGCRIHLRGRSTMTCSPDAFQVDVYHLPGVDRALLDRAATIAVAGHRGSILCQGRAQDVSVSWREGSELTSYWLTDCEDFAHGVTSLSLAAGASVAESLRAVVAHSTSPLPLIHCPTASVRLHRGQTFHGGTAQAVTMLAKAMDAKAYTTRGGLYILSNDDTAAIATISEDELLDTPTLIHGGAVIRIEAAGLLIGQRISVQAAELRGVYRLAAQTFDADSLKGPWRCELTLLDERTEWP